MVVGVSQTVIELGLVKLEIYGVTSDLSSEESGHDCSEEESEREEAGSHPLNE